MEKDEATFVWKIVSEFDTNEGSIKNYLKAGYEPFAVEGGKIWLRRKVPQEALDIN